MHCPDLKIAPRNGSGAPEAAPVLGQRVTRQRRLIFEILRSSDDHLDVETLYQKARELDSRVSLSTVYRTISLLKESDLVDELVFDDDRRCYEYRKTSQHHHIRCMSCGEIVEFESACAQKMQNFLAELLEYQVESLRMDVSGYCKSCRPR